MATGKVGSIWSLARSGKRYRASPKMKEQEYETSTSQKPFPTFGCLKKQYMILMEMGPSYIEAAKVFGIYLSQLQLSTDAII